MKARIWKIIHGNSWVKYLQRLLHSFNRNFHFLFFANWSFSGPLVVFHKRLGVTSNQLKAFCANFL